VEISGNFAVAASGVSKPLPTYKSKPLSANPFAMNLQEMHDEHVRHGYDAKDGMKFGLKAMSWSGWGSPVGLGILLLCAGGFLYLLHLAGLIG